MVVPNPPGETQPPGGSNHAGSFQKGAFCAQFVPKEGAKRVQQLKAEQAAARDSLAMHALNVDFALTKEQFRPSRLRSAFTQYKENPPPGPGWEARARAQLSQSASSPVLAGAGAASVGSSAAEADLSPETPGASSSEFPDMDVSRQMNRRYYPHPTLNRGFLRLSGGRAKDWGIDLDKAPGVQCTFWEGPKDRMGVLKNMPGAQPRVPPQAAKWNSQEAWDNPANHHTHKVR